jgi:hypothetical protein
VDLVGFAGGKHAHQLVPACVTLARKRARLLHRAGPACVFGGLSPQAGLLLRIGLQALSVRSETHRWHHTGSAMTDVPWIEWYQSLAKPSWTPAPRTIGLIWQVLYPVIIATCSSPQLIAAACGCRLLPQSAKPPTGVFGILDHGENVGVRFEGRREL